MQLFAENAPLVGSDSWWKNPERIVASSDPDEATAQTIKVMCRDANRAARDGIVRDIALGAMQHFGGLAGNNDAESCAGAAFWWCKHFIKFVHHEFILRQKLGEAGHLQGLISPDALVRMQSPEGDCAIFTECVCAFLKVLGVPYEMVTVAVNPNEPEMFSHVFAYAKMPDGSRLPLDASHGKFPGWQVPSSDVSRRQVWDEAGNPVADQGSRFDGLHNYSVRGMGDDSVDLSNLYPTAPGPTTVDTSGIDLSTLYPTGSPTDTTGLYSSGTGPNAGTSPGFNWSGELASLLNQWSKIGGQVVAPTTTLVRGPNGQLIYTSPAGSSSSAPLLGTSLAGSNTLLLLGGGLLALLVVGSMMKGGR